MPTLKSSGADSSRPTAGVPQDYDSKVVRRSERHIVMLAESDSTLCKSGKGWGAGTIIDVRIA